MKKISKILIVLFIAIVTFNVNAFRVGQEFTWGDPIPYSGNINSVFWGTGKNYTTNTYRVNEGDYPIYCLDPGAPTPPKDDYGIAHLYVSRVLMDSSQYRAKDKGILYAIKYDTSSELDVQTRFAKGIAVRMLVDGVYGWSNANARQSDVSDLVAASQVARTYCNKGSSTYSGGALSAGSGSHGLTIGTDVIKEVLSSFCAGLNAYENYDSNTDKTANVAGRVKSHESIEGGTQYILEFEISNFNLESISSGEASLYINEDLTNTGSIISSKIIGASMEYRKKIDGNYDADLFTQLASGNALEVVKEVKDQLDNSSGNAKFYVAVEVIYDKDLAKATDGTCNMQSELKFKFSHPDSINGAVLRADFGGYDVSSYQRFVIFAPINDKSVQMDPCSETCETSKNLITSICEDELDDAEHPGQPDENGNVVYSFREGYFADQDKYDIKKCILNNKDEALNTYQYMDNDYAAALTNNTYCSLYCKEDYVFNVPYKRNTANGRYFQIDMDIASSQTCYTSQINKEQVNEVLVELQRELIEAYNEYTFYRYLTEHTPKEDTSLNVSSCSQKYSCTSNPKYTRDAIGTNPDGTTKYGPYYIDYYTFTYDKTTECLKDSRGCNSDRSSTPTPVYGTIVFNESVFVDGTDGTKENPQVVNYHDINNYVPSDSIVKTDNNGTGGATRAIFGGASNTGGKADCKSREYIENSSTGSCTQKSGTENYYDWTTFSDDYNNLKDDFIAKRDDAATRVKQIIKDIDANVKAFDSCTGTGNIQYYSQDTSKSSAAWYADFKYNPVIKYSYDEPNIESYEPNQKWIEQARAINADIMLVFDANVYGDFCDHGNSADLGSEVTCNSSTEVKKLDFLHGGLSDSETIATKQFIVGCINDSYEPGSSEGCTLGAGKYISAGEVATNVTKYQLIDFKVGDTIDKNGQVDWSFTNVNYVSTTASAESRYDTPRVYYSGGPTGNVVVSQNQPAEDANNPENFSQVDGLPVSIQTPLGTYFYKILFENIGTYYYTGHLGRIYGEGSSLSDLKEPASIKNNKNLETNAYACTYDVGNTCIDSGRNSHTIYECFQDENWEDCKARLCDVSLTLMCVETAENGYCKCSGNQYSEDKCICYGHSKEDRLQVLDEVCSGSEKNDSGEYINCSHNYNCCPYCTIECIGTCIFESKDIDDYNGEFMMDFRPVNIASLNPNERELGYNWNPGTSNGDGTYNWSTGAVTNVLVAQKAGITIEEIQSRASITDIEGASATQLGSLTDYSLDVTLTPSMITYIKNYNKAALSSGSYNNQTLKCYDYELNYDYTACKEGGFSWIADDYTKPTGSGKCMMENIMCYSSFIDELKSDFSDLVDTNHRPAPINISEKEGSSNITPFVGVASKYGTNVEAVDGVQVKNVQDYWGIFRYTTLDINGDKVPDIGPSWK